MSTDKEKDILEMLIKSGEEHYHNVSVDVVILGYHDRTMKVLLQKPKFADAWMLPGGYIKRTNTTAEAAAIVLEERTRLKNLPLYYFNVFSKPGRSRGAADKITEDMRKVGFEPPKDFWMFDDFITIGYFALTEFSRVEPSGDYFAEECQWFSAYNLPEMMYDHKEIVNSAIMSLRYLISFHPIGYELLPDKFTLPEIHSLYETILGKKLDERNFAKKLTNIGLIKRLNERRNIGAHRAPYLYVYDKEVYDKYVQDNNVAILGGFQE